MPVQNWVAFVVNYICFKMFKKTHSSSELAFPKHCEYACSFQVKRKTWPWKLLCVLVVLFIGGYYALA